MDYTQPKSTILRPYAIAVSNFGTLAGILTFGIINIVSSVADAANSGVSSVSSLSVLQLFSLACYF